MRVVRKSRLDLHKIQGINLGLFREAFDQVVSLEGILLRPSEDSSVIWGYENPFSGERGRMLDVEGFLGTGPVSLSFRGLVYTITRQGFTLALAFPAEPKRVQLNRTRHRVLSRREDLPLPSAWPEELIQNRIRLRFRRVAVLDEQYLLREIGLRSR